MKKRILSISLVLAMCLTLIPVTAQAADYTATKLNIKAERVWNVNGYATIDVPVDGAGYSTNADMIDRTGKIVRKIPGVPTNDGYYLKYSTLYDENFNEVLSFDPYEVIHGEQRPSFGGMGSSFGILAGGGVIVLMDEPLILLDYSGKVTGRYTPDTLHVDPYGSDSGVNIGLDGILTIWLGQYAGQGNEYKWVFLDKTGKVLADLGDKYSNVGTLNEGLTYAFVPDGDGGYDAYYIDKTGKIQFSVDAIGLSVFLDGYALAVTGTWEEPNFGVIDKSGKWVIEPQYESIGSLAEGIFAAKKGGKYGYVDANNKVLVPFEYDELSQYSHGVGYGVKNGDLYAIVLNTPATQDSPSSWAVKEVDAAIEAGLVPVSLQKSYKNEITRGEVAQMFIRLIELSSGQTIEAFMAAKGVSINNNAFTDTSDKDVLAANALGIIQGVGGNRFDPGGVLSRAQIAGIINRVARAMGVDTSGSSHSFTDVKGHWVDPELGWPVKEGIIQGVGNNRFNPNGRLTTEAAILITYRALLKLSQDR